MSDYLNDAAMEWLAARDIIAAAIQELRRDFPKEETERVAAAILARLANHKPPIITSFVEY